MPAVRGCGHSNTHELSVLSRESPAAKISRSVETVGACLRVLHAAKGKTCDVSLRFSQYFLS